MKAPVIYLPEAKADVRSAYAKYEHARSGLGDRFLGELEKRIEAVCDNPEMYGVVHNEVRAAPLSKFPYVIYFRWETDQIFVLAVLHGHRDQQVWSRRRI